MGVTMRANIRSKHHPSAYRLERKATAASRGA
jgi:hypothetical protein